ncbi:MAG: FKBP-type peptidyl-prolyl cis-trans isomerase [Pirellulales bacterium]|nr:FKBP-type peptidyl-prolyl cis-trans isomerase [Pirellulales bacterium]
MVDRKKSSRPVLACLIAVLLVSGWALAQSPTGKQPEGVAAGAAVELKSDKQKFSYGIGFQMGSSVRQQGIADDLEIAAFLRGVTDGMSGNKLALSQLELRPVMERYGKEIEQRLRDKSKVAAAKNKQEGDRFLAENKAKEGVKTLPSGLQYKVLKSGSGATPGPADTVLAHYHGTLIDGTVFDSSVQRGEPIEFPVNGVIKGWTEALQLMKVGDKWQLFVPSDLAYGERSPSDKIGPNSVLIFEVELKDVKKEPTAK